MKFLNKMIHSVFQWRKQKHYRESKKGWKEIADMLNHLPKEMREPLIRRAINRIRNENKRP